MLNKVKITNTENQKTAIVTGGGSGIGLAIAKKITETGITTIILGRNEDKLEQARQQLGEYCIPMQCDLTDLAAISSVVQKIISNYGRIDVLVNNAGINQKKEFTEVTDEEFQRILLTNVTAVFPLSREVVKHMLQNSSGAVINISSMASQYGIPKVIAYRRS